MKRIIKVIKKRLNTINQLANKYKESIELTIKIAGIVTILISVWSIREEIKTRNSEYRPFLALEQTEKSYITIAWNENDIAEPPTVTGSLPALKLVNVGNGNAVDISIVVEENELEAWKKELSKIGQDIELDYIEDESDLQEFCPYILIGEDNYKEINVPQVWLDYLAEICKNADFEDSKIELPPIKFQIKYYDTQYEILDYDCIIDVEIKNTSASNSNNGEKTGTYSVEFKKHILQE